MTDALNWVIRTNGAMFWRANSAGYTRSIVEAGVFTEADARRQAVRRPPNDTDLDEALPLETFRSELARLRWSVDDKLAALGSRRGSTADGARAAVSELRDAARAGGLDFRIRDELVAWIHAALDLLDAANDTIHACSERTNRERLP